jgi:hypothetical protein
MHQAAAGGDSDKYPGCCEMFLCHRQCYSFAVAPIGKSVLAICSTIQWLQQPLKQKHVATNALIKIQVQHYI